MSGKSFRASLRPLLLIAGAFLLLSCASLRPQTPEVSLLGITLDELTLSHANLLANLRLFNPNRFPLNVEGIEYTFALNGIRVADGRALAPVRLDAEGTGEAVLRLSASYLNLLQLTSRLEPEEQLNYSLEGSVRVGGLRVLDQRFPFRHEGIIDSRLLPFLRER